MEQVIEALFSNPSLLMLFAFMGGVLVTGTVLSILLLRRSSANRDSMTILSNELIACTVERDNAQSRITDNVTLISELQVENQLLARKDAQLTTRIEESRRAHFEKEKLLRENGEALKQEFEILANKVFQSQGEQFTKRNKDQLSVVLDPFKEQMKNFRERIEQVHTNDSKDRASLLTELKNLQQASEKINLEASNLTKALKGDKKLQGNWGELVLETVLKESGLRSGHEYTTQMSARNESGELKRPDVVIHLPDDKDIVVDAKVSLVAYEKALSAEDDEQRQHFVDQHVSHIKDQVRRLSEQDYERLKGVRSLDFVLLFLPIEPAFILAMEEDPALFQDAFSKRIMIVSPTTLMMTLRIIDNIWRYEKQNQNAQEIASRAGAIYDKLRGTIEDMETLGRALKSAEKAFDTANNKLSTGKGNLVKRVEQFRELGATPKKNFSRAVLEDAEAEIGE